MRDISSIFCLQPQDISFKRVWRHRYVFDNEIEFPQGVSYLPNGHYSAVVKSLPAELSIKDKSGNIYASFHAPENIAPPYTMHLTLCGRNRPAIFVTKDGKTQFSSLESFPDSFEPRQKTDITNLSIQPSGGIEKVNATLSIGVGQADVRFVTSGRQGKLYLEGTKAYFTFSARFYGSVLAVGSIDLAAPENGVKLEGNILFDYGDGLLRNDLSPHLFYDDESNEWRAWSSNFSTASDSGGAKGYTGRAEGGLNASWSSECPLHGLSIMNSKPLGLTGMNEDPCGIWDEEAKKWRLFVSAFTEKGIKAQMLESDHWDKDFTPITMPVPEDSTGTTIATMNGKRYCLTGSSDRAYYVYSYPMLQRLGTMKLSPEPWGSLEGWPHGRGWPAFIEVPRDLPYRYLLLTMDRINFPSIPTPNWTYGELSVYCG